MALRGQPQQRTEHMQRKLLHAALPMGWPQSWPAMKPEPESSGTKTICLFSLRYRTRISNWAQRQIHSLYESGTEGDVPYVRKSVLHLNPVMQELTVSGERIIVVAGSVRPGPSQLRLSVRGQVWGCLLWCGHYWTNITWFVSQKLPSYHQMILGFQSLDWIGTSNLNELRNGRPQKY